MHATYCVNLTHLLFLFPTPTPPLFLPFSNYGDGGNCSGGSGSGSNVSSSYNNGGMLVVVVAAQQQQQQQCNIHHRNWKKSVNFESSPCVLFSHSPVTAFLIDPNIPLITMFSNTLSLYSSIKMVNNVHHP